jgi:glycosyltransferase involved in cell wall biosynthesis
MPETTLYRPPPGRARAVVEVVVGVGLLVAGVVMLVTPGPGLLALAAGTALLARHSSWIRRATQVLAAWGRRVVAWIRSRIQGVGSRTEAPGPSTSASPRGRTLRIAVLGPISWRTPPRHYGPWELFASLLTEGLVARGVDVTLFATGDSITSAQLVGTAPTGYSEDPTLDAKVWESLHVAAAFERAADFDLIHNGADFVPLTYSRLVDTPLVTTIHGFASDATLPVYKAYADRSAYVAISEADRHPALEYAATIHHGIDLSSFALHTEPGGHLVSFGRIHPDKGTAEAIDVALAAEVPLVIAGIVHDEEYFRREVEPRVDGVRVTYLGSVGPQVRQQVLGGALALLHLIAFDEPFGFSVVEAMACGTPVIAYPRGSMPELIADGENGMLVTTREEAVSAVGRARSLDRTGVRRSVETRFSVDRMVDEYLALYHRLIER